jgi:hypothetical protein
MAESGHGTTASTKNHDGNGSFPRAVQFDQEDALPPAKLELSVCYIQGFRCPQEERLAVRVPVGLFLRSHVDRAKRKIVVQVHAVLGGKILQCAPHIFQKQGFVFIHQNRRGRMPGLNVDEPALNSGMFQNSQDFIREIDEL